MEMKGTIFHLQLSAVFSRPVWNMEMKGTFPTSNPSLCSVSQCGIRKWREPLSTACFQKANSFKKKSLKMKFPCIQKAWLVYLICSPPLKKTKHNKRAKILMSIPPPPLAPSLSLSLSLSHTHSPLSLARSLSEFVLNVILVFDTTHFVSWFNQYLYHSRFQVLYPVTNAIEEIIICSHWNFLCSAFFFTIGCLMDSVIDVPVGVCCLSEMLIGSYVCICVCTEFVDLRWT